MVLRKSSGTRNKILSVHKKKTFLPIHAFKQHQAYPLHTFQEFTEITNWKNRREIVIYVIRPEGGVFQVDTWTIFYGINSSYAFSYRTFGFSAKISYDVLVGACKFFCGTSFFVFDVFRSLNPLFQTCEFKRKHFRTFPKWTFLLILEPSIQIFILTHRNTLYNILLSIPDAHSPILAGETLIRKKIFVNSHQILLLVSIFHKDASQNARPVHSPYGDSSDETDPRNERKWSGFLKSPQTGDGGSNGRPLQRPWCKVRSKRFHAGSPLEIRFTYT